MHGVIGDLMHLDQTCAVPGCRVSDSLDLVREVIQFMEERGLSLNIVNLDQEKVFNRVSHQHDGCFRPFWLWIKFDALGRSHVSGY